MMQVIWHQEGLREPEIAISIGDSAKSQTLLLVPPNAELIINPMMKAAVRLLHPILNMKSNNEEKALFLFLIKVHPKRLSKTYPIWLEFFLKF